MSDTAAFAAFLAWHALLATEDEVWAWGGVPTPLLRTTYLADAAPPLALVTSVRAVVFRDGEVLVIRDPKGDHYIIPGGRREGGETIEATARREVLEETGWHTGALAPLAVAHYRHLGPRPSGYPYPYPDFAQLIFLAEAAGFDPDGRIPDEWVADSAFRAVPEARALLESRPSERLLLAAVLARRAR